jgi:hypothetical protein
MYGRNGRTVQGEKMPKVDDELNTSEELDEQGEQEVDVDTDESDESGFQDDDAGDSGASNQGQREHERVRKPFLEVDERTKYMTPDEAKRGFSEAGKRIAALSAWEKELKDYGELSPSDVRAYLDELIESRQSVETMKSELQKFKEERERSERDSSNRTRVESEAKLTKEEKDAVDWLKTQLPNLGYISKEDAMAKINELTQSVSRIDKVEQFMQTQQQQYRASLISDSQTKLKSWMGEDGFTDDEEGSLQLVIESSIKDWVDSDPTGRRSQRFYAGGAVKDALIKEGYDRATKALGGLKKSTSTSNFVRNKADALKRNAKKLPVNDVAKGSKNLGKPKKRIDSSGKRDYIGEKHNEAWEKFQSIANRSEEE